MIAGISTMIFGKEKRHLTLEEIKTIVETGMKYIELADSHDVNSQTIEYLHENDISIFSMSNNFLFYQCSID